MVFLKWFPFFPIMEFPFVSPPRVSTALGGFIHRNSIEDHKKIYYLIVMPAKKNILNFAVESDLMKRLDDFRFENRINTRSQAIRRFLDEALKKYEKKSKK